MRAGRPAIVSYTVWRGRFNNCRYGRKAHSGVTHKVCAWI